MLSKLVQFDKASDSIVITVFGILISVKTSLHKTIPESIVFVPSKKFNFLILHPLKLFCPISILSCNVRPTMLSQFKKAISEIIDTSSGIIKSVTSTPFKYRCFAFDSGLESSNEEENSMLHQLAIFVISTLSRLSQP